MSIISELSFSATRKLGKSNISRRKTTVCRLREEVAKVLAYFGLDSFLQYSLEEKMNNFVGTKHSILLNYEVLQTASAKKSAVPALCCGLG
jgi:hypothetical protein